MCKAHTALQDLQAVAMTLHIFAFWSSGKVVASHLDNFTAKVYLCYQCGTVSHFLSRMGSQILSLTDNHSIMAILAYIPTHSNVETDYLSWGQLLPKWHLLPHIGQAPFQLWGLPEVDLLESLCITQCQ